MASIPWLYGPTDGLSPDPWDTVVLGNVVLPGIATVDIERGPQTNVATLPGQEGARVTLMGNPPANVTISLVSYVKYHLEVLEDLLPGLEAFDPKASNANANGGGNSYLGRVPKAYEMIHPIAQIRGIKGVIITKIKGPKRGSIPGTLETVFECLELRKPLKLPAVYAQIQPGQSRQRIQASDAS